MFKLSLKDCTLTNDAISRNWLSTLSIKVSELEITNSNLKYIRVEAFDSAVFKRNLNSLTIDNSLYVASNSLIFQFFAADSFKGLSTLTSLTLLNIPTMDVQEPLALEHLEDLRSLKISRIANAWSPSSLLSAVKLNITELDLSFNNFKSLNASMFTGVAASVKILTLSSSKIVHIASKTFDNFDAVHTLYLMSNSLTIIPSDLFDVVLNNKLSVDLASNKWICNCDLLFLQELMLANSKVFGTQVKCASPDALKDIAIVKLDVTDFCPPDANETTDIEEPPVTPPEDTTSKETEG